MLIICTPSWGWIRPSHHKPLAQWRWARCRNLDWPWSRRNCSGFDLAHREAVGLTDVSGRSLTFSVPEIECMSPNRWRHSAIICEWCCNLVTKTRQCRHTAGSCCPGPWQGWWLTNVPQWGGSWFPWLATFLSCNGFPWTWSIISCDDQRGYRTDRSGTVPSGWHVEIVWFTHPTEHHNHWAHEHSADGEKTLQRSRQHRPQKALQINSKEIKCHYTPNFPSHWRTRQRWQRHLWSVIWVPAISWKGRLNNKPSKIKWHSITTIFVMNCTRSSVKNVAKSGPNKWNEERENGKMK